MINLTSCSSYRYKLWIREGEIIVEGLLSPLMFPSLSSFFESKYNYVDFYINYDNKNDILFLIDVEYLGDDQYLIKKVYDKEEIKKYATIM